jgi:hypothetical protein
MNKLAQYRLLEKAAISRIPKFKTVKKTEKWMQDKRFSLDPRKRLEAAQQNKNKIIK